MSEQTKELTALANHFKMHSGMKLRGAYEDRTFNHWKRLELGPMNVEDMEKLTIYIRNTFTEKGKYSHLLPSLHSYEGTICLTVDVEWVKRFIMK